MGRGWAREGKGKSEGGGGGYGTRKEEPSLLGVGMSWGALAGQAWEAKAGEQVSGHGGPGVWGMCRCI